MTRMLRSRASYRAGSRPLLALVTCLLVLSISVAPIASAASYREEQFSFETNVVPGTTNDTPVRVEATSYIPVPAKYPLSAVVIVPSSGGVEDEREIYYAIELAKAGIAAVVVDSFTARGVEDSIYDQSALESWDMENDAIAALMKLRDDRRFDPKRIAIMGVSKGGTVARDAALTVRRRWMKQPDVEFSAHIAISPDCVWTNRSNQTTHAPILFLLAELDDQTPPQACVEQAQRMIAEGNKNVTWKTYIGAHHAWEELGAAPEFDKETENYSKCRVWVEDDGRMVSGITGEVIPERHWRAWAIRNCMTKGATCCGGTPALKEAATHDIIEFLRSKKF